MVARHSSENTSFSNINYQTVLWNNNLISLFTHSFEEYSQQSWCGMNTLYPWLFIRFSLFLLSLFTSFFEIISWLSIFHLRPIPTLNCQYKEKCIHENSTNANTNLQTDPTNDPINHEFAPSSPQKEAPTRNSYDVIERIADYDDAIRLSATRRRCNIQSDRGYRWTNSYPLELYNKYWE